MVNTRGSESRTPDSRLDDLEKATTAINSKLDGFMTEIRAAMAVLTAGLSQVPPSGESSATPDSPVLPPPGSPPLLMPTFDGTAALAWLARAEQFFLVSHTPTEARLPIAMAALAGPALPWIQLLKRRDPDLSWDRFTQELIQRFGDSMALDEYEAFAAIRHEDSLADYVAAFEARLANISDLSDRQYLGFFLANLRPEIRLHMQSATISSYSHAVQLALRFESLNRATTPVSAPPPPTTQVSSTPSRPPPRFHPSNSYSTAASSPSRPPPRRFRNVSGGDSQTYCCWYVFSLWT